MPVGPTVALWFPTFPWTLLVVGWTRTDLPLIQKHGLSFYSQILNVYVSHIGLMMVSHVNAPVSPVLHPFAIPIVCHPSLQIRNRISGATGGATRRRTR